MITPSQSIASLPKNATCLVDKAQLDRIIQTLASQINLALHAKNPLVYTIMNGALVFAGQLLPQLNFPLQISYLHATRYGQATQGGKLTWLAQPSEDLKDRCVLLLDDIFDEGHTLFEVVEYCRAKGAKEVFTAVLVNKRHQRKISPTFTADFVGIELDDFFLFGFGMDYQGYWRNAPGIFALLNE